MLINFTSGVFKSEKEMDFTNSAGMRRATNIWAILSTGLVRWASMQIWNKQGKAQLGWLFEYSDPDAFKRCQPIFKQIESDFSDIEFQLSAYRGVVLEEYIAKP